MSQLWTSTGGTPVVSENFMFCRWILIGPGDSFAFFGNVTKWTQICWPSSNWLVRRTWNSNNIYRLKRKSCLSSVPATLSKFLCFLKRARRPSLWKLEQVCWPLCLSWRKTRNQCNPPSLCFLLLEPALSPPPSHLAIVEEWDNLELQEFQKLWKFQ